MNVFQVNRIRPSASAPSVARAALLLALTGCASELTPEEIADFEDQGPYVGDDEVASTAQALAGVPASTGYIWANDATRTTPYEPFGAWSFNSEGEDNIVDKQEANGVGRYRVEMKGLTAPGNVQVTAYGPGAARCNLRSLATNANGGIRFDVNCFTAGGIHTDSMFVAFYNNTGDTSGKLAMASVSSTAEVSDIANILTATRLNTGHYRIFMPRTIGTGVPFATARTTLGSFCHPSRHGVDLEDGIKEFADIRCFNSSGNPTNVAFQFTYMSKPNFTQIESALSVSESTSDNLPGGYYSSTDSFRVVNFDYTDPTSLNVGVFWTGVTTQTTSLVNAYSTSAVFCKPSGWFGTDHYTTSVLCHDVTGAARKARVTNAFFGVP
jgi:hypothetical protein